MKKKNYKFTIISVKLFVVMSQINVLGKWEATRESRLWVKMQMIKSANDKNCLFYFYWVKCQ